MNSLISTVRLIIAIQRILDLVLDAILEKRNEADREILRAAILEARNAKSDDEKRAAARKIQESFRHRGVVDGSATPSDDA